MNVAIAGVCAMEWQTSDEYPDLYVAKSGEWLFDLLPETFSWSGDVIYVASRRQKYREESGKAGPFDRDFRIIERRAGSLVSELEIDCDKLAFATRSINRAGDIGSGELDSQVAPTLEKPAAGTVGEATVRLACLIR